jgi:GT2 family glycosyltransferase
MLSIIIVNYKNEEKTIRYVQEELVKITIPHKIVIVNNQANDKSNASLVNALNAELITNIDQLSNIAANCFVIAHPDNLGFAKGNNLGVKFCQLNFDNDFYLFSNNDIALIDNDVVEKLMAKLGQLPDVALIGPKVLGLKGENQSPEPYLSFWNRYVWMYWLTPFLTKKRKENLFQLNYSQKAKEGVHYKIMGSFFMIKADDFIKCGMMDANTFLFGEEIILSERLKRIGKQSYYYPEVAILHEHSLTISKYINQRSKVLQQFKSECYYYRTYKNLSLCSILIGKLSVVCHLKLKAIFHTIRK